MAAGDEKVGVLEAERRRVQAWADAGLPDPVAVRSLEHLARDHYDAPPGWRHGDRAVIDAFVDAHGVEALPHPLPNNWS